MGAIINRELKNRIRTINGIGQHKTIVRNDLRLITKIIQQLDDRWNIWESLDNNNIEKKTEATSTDDSEISSSTAAMVISPVKNKKPIGFVSHNPLLKNITEYLVEEADAEEEELLGETSSNQPKDANTFEMDKELTKVNKQNQSFLISFSSKSLQVLDRLILYLRVVHSIDYYNGTEYAQEDFMPNRCGVIYVRGPPLSSITEAELTNFMQQFETRLKPFIEFHEKLDDDEAMKLGAKNEQDEVEKFINANCQEVGKDKWSCPLSGKKFKGPEFVRKHILNKHQDKIDEAKKDVRIIHQKKRFFFDIEFNYIFRWFILIIIYTISNDHNYQNILQHDLEQHQLDLIHLVYHYQHLPHQWAVKDYLIDHQYGLRVC
jgi:hypothetical protein